MPTIQALWKGPEQGFGVGGWRRVSNSVPAMGERIKVLEARLMATTAVLETLVSLDKIDPAYLETVQRVLRHANAALEGV